MELTAEETVVLVEEWRRQAMLRHGWRSMENVFLHISCLLCFFLMQQAQNLQISRLEFRTKALLCFALLGGLGAVL
nr:hypothetical protein CFP56_78792 [Quercus suber]